MKKKINVDQLKPGMFIHDFNCSWLDHPFFGNSLKVTDTKTINKIVNNGIHEVYIDTEKGLDVADAPTEEEVFQEIQAEINQVAEINLGTGKVPFQEEIVKAKEIRKEAKQTIIHLMDDIRFGRQIETEKVEHIVVKMVRSIFRNQGALICLGRIKQADEYTYLHSISVCALMISFGIQLGLDFQQLKDIGIGAMLHDIGKMKVPQEILNRTGPLSDEEYEKIKEHVEYSRMLLEELPGMADTSILLAAQHHERMDGSGYPNGLKGNEISTFGQIAAIVDVYDAITSERCYRRKVSPTVVLRKLFEWSKFHFNSELVQQFIRCVGIYPVGSLVRLESGFLAVVIDHRENDLLHPTVRIMYDTKTGKHITPYDIDLSGSFNSGRKDRIQKHESPDEWNIDSQMYI